MTFKRNPRKSGVVVKRPTWEQKFKKRLPCKSAKRMRLNVKKQIKLVMDNIKQTHLFPSQRFENPNWLQGAIL